MHSGQNIQIKSFDLSIFSGAWCEAKKFETWPKGVATPQRRITVYFTVQYIVLIENKVALKYVANWTTLVSLVSHGSSGKI